MTIDEAIAHAREVAESNRRKVENDCVTRRTYLYPFCECIKCAEEHEQLAEWLEELKELRKEKDKFERNLKFFSEINEKCCKEGWSAGYSKAENDYYAQTEKDRQSSYDCGYGVGYAKGVDDACEYLKCEWSVDNLQTCDDLLTRIRNIADFAREQDEKILKLYALTGLSIDDLIDLFAKGYTLEPPKCNTESLAELLRETERNI